MKKVLRHLKIIMLILTGMLAVFFLVLLILTMKGSKETRKDEFIPIDGSRYFDSEGKPEKNLWLSSNEKKYYVGDYGILLKSEMQTIDGKTYYFDDSSALVTSATFLLDGKYYTAAEDGAISLGKGFLTVDGNTVYADKEGRPVKDQIVTADGKQYLVDQEGFLVTGKTLLRQEKMYTAAEDGVLTPASGWQEVDGISYYGEADGTVAKNTQVPRGTELCYLDEEGQAVTASFYTYGDKLFYADEKGNTRRTEGCLELDGRCYYSDSEGAFYHSEYVTVDGEKFFTDAKGARIWGKPTIDQYLKCENIYEYMEEHFSDYYFKTPYRSLKYTGDPQLLIQPYGLYGEDGGMNCTGFISSLITYSGGDLTRVSDMGRFGGYGNGDNYLMLATRGVVQYEHFKTVKQLLASGKAKKGNIFYLAPVWKSGQDCHMAVFWGETSDENKIWSQTAKTLCTVTEIYMVDPINEIFMYPLSCNLEVDNTLKPTE